MFTMPSLAAYVLSPSVALILAIPISAEVRPDRSEISVVVYDYACLSEPVRTRSLWLAARIFARAGIETTWLIGPQHGDEAPPFAPPFLVLRILSAPMARSLLPKEGGFAVLPEDRAFAFIAAVCPYKAGELSRTRSIPEEVTLGYFVAHEIGHLLLGLEEHSTFGIMHTPWRPSELELMRKGLLRFLGEEARRMKMEVQRRHRNALVP